MTFTRRGSSRVTSLRLCMWPHVAHKVRRGPNASRLIFPLFAPITILIPGGHMVTLKIAHVCDVNLLIASEEDF